MIFDGEYYEGKKYNGKVKEYSLNELVFEGEYVNGSRWNGKGKEYNELISYHKKILPNFHLKKMVICFW